MNASIYSYFNSISPLSPTTWQQVAPIFESKPLKKGEYFVEAGPVASTFAFLEEGLVRVFYRNAGGVEYNKHFFQAPTTIGAYSSLVTGKPNLIYQQALTDCTIWVANYARFCSNYDQFPELERLARRNAEFYFVEKEQREVELVLLDAGQRYALLQQRHPRIGQLVAQYHIASYLGITPTQLSRIRRALLVG